MKELHKTYPLTPQQALENVFIYFVVNKMPPGYNPITKKCMYWDEEKKCGCAIGCQLPIEEAKRWQELFPETAIYGIANYVGDSVRLESKEFKTEEVTSRFRTELSGTAVYSDLQSAHDNSARDSFDGDHSDPLPEFRDELTQLLQDVAGRFDLKLDIEALSEK